MKNLKISPLEATAMLLSLLLAISLFTFAAPCDQMVNEDGSPAAWMTCHWMSQATLGLSFAMVAIGFMSMCFVSRRIKIGLSVAMAPVALATLCMPLLLIGVCSHSDARCVTITQPVIIVLSVLIAVLSLLNAVSQYLHVQKRQR